MSEATLRSHSWQPLPPPIRAPPHIGSFLCRDHLVQWPPLAQEEAETGGEVSLPSLSPSPQSSSLVLVEVPKGAEVREVPTDDLELFL